jgi:hypothetical protein
MLLLFEGRRVELALIPDSEPTPPPRARSSVGSLLVAVALDLSPADTPGRLRFERIVRTIVDRAYARYGISPVEYDLQMI